MAKFKKKPVVVDAEPIDELLHGFKINLPPWVKENIDEGNLVFKTHHVEINTREGVMKGNKSDMLIKGVEGEIYPCDKKIFYKTYQAA